MNLLQTTRDRSVGAWLESARRRLRDAPFEPSTREATLLASYVCHLPEATVLAHPEAQLAKGQAARLERLLQRRLDGEPIAYLTGQREFYGRTLTVDERVLVPRPETEHLVGAVLDLPLPERPRILDIGTGTGAIALTLALEIQGSRLFATDDSLGALAVAAENSSRWQTASRVRLLAADLWDALTLSAFDLVVSNPPYISPDDARSLSEEITRYEPPGALFAPPDGLGIIRRLLTGPVRMQPGTWLALEIGQGQLDAVLALTATSGFETHEVVEDYAGIPRVVVVRRC